MTSFVETRFPTRLAYGASGGPRFSTDIVERDGGAETRGQNWATPRADYAVDVTIKTKAQRDELISFFRAVAKGRAYGFRLRDPLDNSVSQDGTLAGSSGILGSTGLAIPGQTHYQASKKYLSGANSLVRSITKPVASSPAPAVYANGVALAGSSLASTTGIWTLAYPKQGNIDNVTRANPCEIHAVGFGAQTAVGHTVIVTGVGGMVELSGAYPVVNILTVNAIQIGVDSTAFSNYSGGGLVYEDWLGTEVLTWSGDFDVPVRWDGDYLGMRAIARDASGNVIADAPGIRLVEVRELA